MEKDMFSQDIPPKSAEKSSTRFAGAGGFFALETPLAVFFGTLTAGLRGAFASERKNKETHVDHIFFNQKTCKVEYRNISKVVRSYLSCCP